MALTDPETQVTRRCRDTWYVPPEPQEAERNSKNKQCPKNLHVHLQSSRPGELQRDRHRDPQSREHGTVPILRASGKAGSRARLGTARAECSKETHGQDPCVCQSSVSE